MYIEHLDMYVDEPTEWTTFDDLPERLQGSALALLEYFDKGWEYAKEHDENAICFLSDLAVALFWYANDYHGGQFSDLYSVASTIDYSPSPETAGPEEDSEAAYYYVGMEIVGTR